MICSLMLFLILKVIADSASVLRSRKQVVTMIATVVVFFFVCMFPIKVCTYVVYYSIFANHDDNCFNKPSIQFIQALNRFSFE